LINNKSPLLHLVGLTLIYLSKMHGHLNINFTYLMFNNVFPRNSGPFVRKCSKIWYSEIGQRWRYRTAHARCVACWVTNATGRSTEYVIHFAFSQQQRQEERASILRLYAHVCWLLCNSTLAFTPDHISANFSLLTSACHNEPLGLSFLTCTPERHLVDNAA